MGEENNLEKRLIFSGMVSASINPEPIYVESPIPGVTFYDSVNLSEFRPDVMIGIDEAEGKDQTTFAFKNLDEETFHITTTDFNEKTLRKIIGLPAIPTKKPKCHKKTFKKALMAYGYSRNLADAICQIIGGRQHNHKKFLGTKAWNRTTNKIEVIHWGYKFDYEHVFTILGD
jgi:hypothetical protein